MLLTNQTKVTPPSSFIKFIDPRLGTLARGIWGLVRGQSEETVGEPGRPRDLAGPGAGVLGVLDRAAADEALSLAGLIQRIDLERGERPLASACRVFALARAAN
jgi:hypothetical protein